MVDGDHPHNSITIKSFDELLGKFGEENPLHPLLKKAEFFFQEYIFTLAEDIEIAKSREKNEKNEKNLEKKTRLHQQWLLVLHLLLEEGVSNYYKLRLVQSICGQCIELDRKTKETGLWKFLDGFNKNFIEPFNAWTSRCYRYLKDHNRFFWSICWAIKWMVDHFKPFWIHANWGRLLLLREKREFIDIGDLVAAQTEVMNKSNEVLNNLYSVLNHLGYLFYFIRLLFYTMPALFKAYYIYGSAGVHRVIKREQESVANDIVWATVGIVTMLPLSIFVSTVVVVGLYIFDVINTMVHTAIREKRIEAQRTIQLRQANGIFGTYKFKALVHQFSKMKSAQDAIFVAPDELKESTRLRKSIDFVTLFVIDTKEFDDFASQLHQLYCFDEKQSEGDKLKYAHKKFGAVRFNHWCTKFKNYVNYVNNVKETPDKSSAKIIVDLEFVKIYLKEMMINADEVESLAGYIAQYDQLSTEKRVNRVNGEFATLETSVLLSGMLITGVGTIAYLLISGLGLSAGGSIATAIATSTAIATAAFLMSPLGLVSLALIAVGSSIVIGMCIARIVRLVANRKDAEKRRQSIQIEKPESLTPVSIVCTESPRVQRVLNSRSHKKKPVMA